MGIPVLPPLPSEPTAPSTTPMPSPSHFIPKSTSAIVSVVVLLAFAIVAVLAMVRTIQPTEITIYIISTLGTLAVTVVSYWVGSSSGSAIKTDMLHQQSAANSTIANNAIISAGATGTKPLP